MNEDNSPSPATSRVELDKKLDRLGLSVRNNGSEGIQRRDLLQSIRRAKRLENGDTDYQDSPPVTLITIKSSVMDIAHYNRTVEDSIKMELLGLRDDALGRVIYKTKSYLKGKVEPAETVIDNQIRKVDGVVKDLRYYTSTINTKVATLESHYDNVLYSLLAKYEEIGDLTKDLSEKEKLLKETGTVIRESEAPVDKLRYAKSQRDIGRIITQNVHRIKLHDRAIGLLNNELPILDSLSTIGEAYVFTLQEITQESELMKRHLETVSSLYLDMIRAKKYNSNLEGEVRKLFSYTRNMTSAMEKGTELIVERAGNSSIVELEYAATAGNLGAVADKVEQATFSAFNDLERRLNRYSTETERRLEQHGAQ